MYLGTIYQILVQAAIGLQTNMAARRLSWENQLRAIDPKLCAYILQSKSNSQTKFRSSLILRFATWGTKPKS
jgi:hypothetical protein